MQVKRHLKRVVVLGIRMNYKQRLQSYNGTSLREIVDIGANGDGECAMI